MNRSFASSLSDPDRLAIGSWSYGGILTDLCNRKRLTIQVGHQRAGSANQISL